MSDQNGREEEPIDADFEPALHVETEKDNAFGAQPGWLGVGVAAAVAAVLGGLIGILGSPGGDAEPPEELTTLTASVSDFETRIAELTAENQRLSRELTAVAANSGDADAIAALTAEMAALSEKIEEEAEAETEAADLAPLIARLESLEQADENDAVSPRQMNRAVTVLRERVEALEADKALVAQGLDVRAEAIAGLTERLAVVEEKVDNRATSESVAEEIASIRNELGSAPAPASSETAESEPEPENRARIAAATRYLGASVALADIESKARRGESFPAEYERLQTLMDESPALIRLGEIAASGAPTIDTLRTGFKETRESLVEEETKSDGWGWVRRAFGGAVKVRRETEETEAMEEALARAEDALKAGNLDDAIEAAAALEGAPAAAFEDWRSEAAARRDLNAALDTLGEALRLARP